MVDRVAAGARTASDPAAFSLIGGISVRDGAHGEAVLDPVHRAT
jgi:hypothetical protein